MLKNIAIVFGLVMLAIGVLGFVPQVTEGDLLLGTFRVNFAHNIVHLATGVIALLCGFKSYDASRVFFQVFGVVYGLVAVLGFFFNHQDIYMLANNRADTFLHFAVAVVSLYLGFVYKEEA